MNSKKKEKQTKQKPISGKKVGNRTVIGLVCILVAFAVCFLVAPMINNRDSKLAEVVRVKQVVEKGSIITAEDIELVSVGGYNLPENICRKSENVVGMYAADDMYPGEYIVPDNISTRLDNPKNILESLNSEQKAISVSISSFANGLSGKLETGDIVSVVVYSQKEDTATTPKELQYVKVITATTSAGVDKADITDNTQPATVTLLVNKTQAELLTKYEKTASMHFVLEYRGDAAVAEQYLKAQEQVFTPSNDTGGKK